MQIHDPLLRGFIIYYFFFSFIVLSSVQSFMMYIRRLPYDSCCSTRLLACVVSNMFLVSSQRDGTSEMLEKERGHTFLPFQVIYVSNACVLALVFCLFFVIFLLCCFWLYLLAFRCMFVLVITFFWGGKVCTNSLLAIFHRGEKHFSDSVNVNNRQGMIQGKFMAAEPRTKKYKMLVWKK